MKQMYNQMERSPSDYADDDEDDDEEEEYSPEKNHQEEQPPLNLEPISL